MLLAVTILSGAILGWEAGKDGLLLIVPPAVAVATALTLVGYLRFLARNWRGVLGRLLHHGSRDFQRESVTILVWSLVLRMLVMGAVGVLAYWISRLSR
jgi:hypothetical protein